MCPPGARPAAWHPWHRLAAPAPGVTRRGGGLHRGGDGWMVLGRDPARVDLLVVHRAAGPCGRGVAGHRHQHVQPGGPCCGHGVQPVDLGDRLLRRLAHRQPAVEPERETVRHGAVARRVQHRPARRAGAPAHHRVVEHPLTTGVAGCCFGEDRPAVLQRVQPQGRHRAVARPADHGDLDLHPAALPAIDAQRALHRIARALGEDHHVGHQIGRCSRQHVAHQVAGPAAVVVLLRDGGVGAHHAPPQRTLVAQLEEDLGGDDL